MFFKPHNSRAGGEHSPGSSEKETTAQDRNQSFPGTVLRGSIAQAPGNSRQALCTRDHSEHCTHRASHSAEMGTNSPIPQTRPSLAKVHSEHRSCARAPSAKASCREEPKECCWCQEPPDDKDTSLCPSKRLCEGPAAHEAAQSGRSSQLNRLGS